MDRRHLFSDWGTQLINPKTLRWLFWFSAIAIYNVSTLNEWTIETMGVPEFEKWFDFQDFVCLRFWIACQLWKIFYY